MRPPRHLFLTVTGVATLVATSVVSPSVRLVYNPSESAPRGFYAALPAIELHRGELVLVALPSSIARLAAQRGYLPASVPALKQIAAMQGDPVCVRDGHVYIDHYPVAQTLTVDGKRRKLSAWNGCRRLLEGELFLLNREAKASFDSRYFGPVDRSFVRARARPLWTW